MKTSILNIDEKKRFEDLKQKQKKIIESAYARASREASMARKADARRKIILGALLVKALNSDNARIKSSATTIYNIILEQVEERDKPLFNGIIEPEPTKAEPTPPATTNKGE